MVGWSRTSAQNSWISFHRSCPLWSNQQNSLPLRDLDSLPAGTGTAFFLADLSVAAPCVYWQGWSGFLSRKEGWDGVVHVLFWHCSLWDGKQIRKTLAFVSFLAEPDLESLPFLQYGFIFLWPSLLKFVWDPEARQLEAQKAPTCVTPLYNIMSIDYHSDAVW